MSGVVATDYTWKNGNSGNWNTSANWNGGIFGLGQYPQQSGDNATFESNSSVTVNTDITVGTITINAGSTVTLTGSGSLKGTLSGTGSLDLSGFTGDYSALVIPAGFSVIYPPAANCKWTGGANSSDWNTPGNWESNVVPTTISNVEIPSGCAYWPVIAADVTVKKIVNDGELTLNSGYFISGKVTNNGTFNIGVGGVSASALHSNFTNTGTVNQSGDIFISDDCVLVDDTGTWNFNNKKINIWNNHPSSIPMEFIGTGTDYNINIANGTLIFPDNITLESLSIDTGFLEGASGKTISIKKSWNSKGTYTPNGGTVYFDNNSTPMTVEALSEAKFYNLKVNGDLTCNNNVTVENDFEIESGNFTSPSVLKLHGNADFSGSASFDANSGNVYFFNSQSDKKTLKTRTNQVFNNVYFGGNVEIDLDGDVTAQKFSVTDPTGATGLYTQTSGFTSTVKGGTSLTVSDDFEFSSLGNVGTLNFDGNFTLNASSFKSYRATTTNIKSGVTVEVTEFVCAEGGTAFSPGSKWNVAGILKATNVKLGTSIVGCELNVQSTGKVETETITSGASRYYNSSSTYAVNNAGTIETKSLSFAPIDGAGNESKYEIYNSGTISLTDSSSVLRAVKISSSDTGIVNFKGGTITVLNTSKIGELNIESDTIISGEFEFTKLNIGKTDLASPLTVKFPAGKTQKIGSIKSTGTAACGVLLTSSDTTSSWLVEFTGSPINSDFKYTTVGYSKSSTELNLVSQEQSIVDSGLASVGFTTEKWFATKYFWLGDTSNDWQDGTNWSINGVDANTDILFFPQASLDAFDIVVLNGTETGSPYILDFSTADVTSGNPIRLKSIVVEASAIADFSNMSIEVSGSVQSGVTTYITNNGTVRLQGIAGQSIVGGMKNGADSTVAYYGNSISNLVWDGNSVLTGNQFENIVFYEGSGSISEVLNVNGTTLFVNKSGNSIVLSGNNTFTKKVILGDSTDTAGNITLSGTNTFTDGVKISEAENVILNCSNTFNIDAMNSTEICNSLDVKSKVALKGNVRSTAVQKYEKAVTLNQNVAIFASDVYFDSTVGGSYKLSIGDSSNTPNVSFLDDVNVSDIEVFGTTTFSKTSAQTIAASNSQKYRGDITASKTSSVTIKSKKNEFFSVNYTAYGDQTIDGANGNFIYLEADKIWDGNFSFKQNLGIFGAKYNADDPRYSGTDTRFELFNYGSYTATVSSSVLTGGNFTIQKNFYSNGVDLSSITLAIPDNSASSPEFNATSAATEKQWGIPYAVAFNSTLTNVTVSGGYLAASTSAQNCVDGAGNSNIQFKSPKIDKAYSVYDDVIYVHFDLPLENSNGEIATNLSLYSNNAKDKGGVWYSSGTQYFRGAYSDADCTQAVPSNTDIQEFYIRGNSSWNTDATGYDSDSINPKSTDRKGQHKLYKTDLSFLEGMFTAADGHTMCRNYGTHLENGSQATAYTDTEDYCSPVLVKVLAGRELHNSSAALQEYYDAHNFIEFVYSEPVDIGDIAFDSGALNIQASSTFSSASEHGGAIVESSGNGIEVVGFAKIASGKVIAGIKSRSGSGWSGTVDSAFPHALYRNFSLTSGGTAENQTHRIRISIAGYVDDSDSLNFGGETFKNWLGYIEEATMVSGNITRVANDFITDRAVDVSSSEIKNKISATATTNHALPQLSLDSSENGLYGKWDISAPVFAPFVNENQGFGASDSPNLIYEIIGQPNRRGDPYLYNVEMHLFDNQRSYYSNLNYSWLSRTGWIDSNSPSTVVSSTPDTIGGIRFSSLDNASSGFSYISILNGVNSSEKQFNTTPIGQNVGSLLFFKEGDVASSTQPDSSYIVLPLNSIDQNNQMSLRTEFKVFYEPGSKTNPKCFITDLAGNRLRATDTGSERKTLNSVDVTPPGFSLSLAPIGHDKISLLFSKPLYYNDISFDKLSSSGGISAAMNALKSNLKIVTSGAEPLNIQEIKFNGSSYEYTELIITLDRNIKLDDIPNTYIKLDNSDIADLNNFQSYIQDFIGNYLENGSTHIISDFAVNAVKPVYAYAKPSDSDTEESWFDEQHIFGESLFPDSDGYAVHDFTANGGNFGKLRVGRDIILQVSYDGDGENLHFISDLKSNIKKSWVSRNINKQRGVSWRIWMPELFTPIASSFNDKAFSLQNPESAGSSGLWNYVFQNETSDVNSRGWKNGDEVQFMFRIGDIIIDHEGYGNANDKTYLYAFSMPENMIAAGNFSFLDLWSFTFSDIKNQVGGVTILNNVIDASVKEQTVLKVDMKSEGNLNIYVMTLDGNIVKRLSKGKVSAGTHYYKWDGTNNAGKTVARGLYFVRVSGKNIDETRKVMVVK